VSPSDDIPLARLFAMAYRVLVDDLHDRLRARGWTDVRPAYGFALLAARDGPTTATDLALLMGTTKQAASKLVAGMVDARYLVPSAGGDDARQRPLRLGDRGRRLLASVEEIYTEIEAEWAEIIGPDGVRCLRRDLARAVRSRHGGELPPIRPTW
jgi:DNA-binding MarR family transcriptional regulator